MPQADATPHFGEREVAPLMRHQMKTLDRFHTQGAFLGRMPHTRHRCPVRGDHSE